MGKILIVISDDLFVRNYLTTDALADVEKENDCYYLASDRVKSREHLENKKHFLGYYHYPKSLEKKHLALFNILMWRFRDRSTSFRFRFRRLMRLDNLKYGGNLRTYVNALVDFVYVNFFYSGSPLRSILLGNRVVYGILGGTYQNRIPVNENLKLYITNLKPDLILFPSSAYDPDGNDVARIGKLCGVPTLFLIDNWDNLSSKSIFWAFPDHLGVWGQQSKEHAMQIHGFSPDRVTPLGTPRFDSYFILRDQALTRHFDFEYVLFAGLAIAFDEIAALRIIEDEIAGKPDVYGGLKVVYRPHPWRQTRISRDHFDEKEYSHVIMDPQLRDAYYHKNTNFQPDLSYYPALLKNAVFVVASPTTMMIESLIFRKRVLVLAYDDGVHLTSPHNALANYVHFRGIERVEGISLCLEKSSLAEHFRRLWLHQEEVDAEKQARDLNYFLFDDGGRYRDRLAALVSKLSKDRA
jgi:hypothetical protein